MQQDAGLKDGKWIFAIPIQIERMLTGNAAQAVNVEKARKPMKMGKAAWPFDTQSLKSDNGTFATAALKMDNN